MEPSYLSLWLTVQILLEGVLVGLMIVFLLRLRRLDRSRGRNSADLEARFTHFIAQAQALSEQLTQNLEEKKELSVGLLLSLERKIQEMNRLLGKADQGPANPPQDWTGRSAPTMENPSAPETRALVLKLAAGGMGVAEIARKVRLHRGEVELILELEQQGGSAPTPGARPAP